MKRQLFCHICKTFVFNIQDHDNLLFKLRYHDNAILAFTIFTHFPLETLSKMLDNKKRKNDMRIRFL